LSGIGFATDLQSGDLDRSHHISGHEDTTMHRKFVALSVAVAFCGMASAAQAGAIDFEEFNKGDDLIALGPNLAIPGSSVTYTVTGSGLGSDSAIVLDTGNITGDDTDQAQPFDLYDQSGTLIDGNYDPGNILVIGNYNGTDVNDTNNSGTLTFTLSDPVNFVQFELFDNADNGGGANVTFEDMNGGSILSFTDLGLGVSPDNKIGDNEALRVQFSAPNTKIASFSITGSGGIDNLRYTEVPVPATLGLLGIGLIGLGLAQRRRMGGVA
jgi:hypothetical protein